MKPLEQAEDAAENESGFTQGGYVWQPYECRYDLMNSAARQACLKDTNATRFLDFGDRYDQSSTAGMMGFFLWVAMFLVWMCCIMPY